jgi:hypothetical protein
MAIEQVRKDQGNSPVAPFIMFTKILQRFNFYHSCFPIFLDATYNFDGDHFLSFSVPAFQNLTKGAYTRNRWYKATMSDEGKLQQGMQIGERAYLLPFCCVSCLQQ